MSFFKVRKDGLKWGYQGTAESRLLLDILESEVSRFSSVACKWETIAWMRSDIDCKILVMIIHDYKYTDLKVHKIKVLHS